MAKETVKWVAIVAVLALAYMFFVGNPFEKEAAVPAVLPGGAVAVTPATAGCSQNPAVTYAAIDKFLATDVAETAYIKENGAAPVSSLANPAFGSELEYWANHSTYFSEPVKHQVSCGANPQVQNKVYKNGTLTLTAYNSAYDSLTSGGGATNVTIAANDAQTFELRFDGTKNEAVVPFGGCLIAEGPTTLTDVQIGGFATGCPYSVTETVSSTSNNIRLFTIPAGFDADGTGAIKHLDAEIKSGADNPVGTLKFTFVPANYYLANDGTFKLNTEKAANSDTTRAFRSSTSFTIGLT